MEREQGCLAVKFTHIPKHLAEHLIEVGAL